MKISDNGDITFSKHEMNIIIHGIHGLNNNYGTDFDIAANMLSKLPGELKGKYEEHLTSAIMEAKAAKNFRDIDFGVFNNM